jgi:precorrin-6A synthase
MRKLFAIGIGTGDPDHLTLQAVKVLAQIDVVFLIDKGKDKADLSPLRRAICERFIRKPGWRSIELADSPRDPSTASYAERVTEWHERRLVQLERALAEELLEDECGAILVWGDPSLYDSTVRLLAAMVERHNVSFEYEVVPGISSPQVLAARHKIALNRIGGAVHVTTGRRLKAGWPSGAEDVLVMLDGECSFRDLDEAGLEIFWGAYLGTEHELLIAGPVEERKGEIERTRARARAEHGWIMDTYLLRRPSEGTRGAR